MYRGTNCSLKNVSFFCIRLSSFPSSIYRRGFFSPLHVLGPLSKTICPSTCGFISGLSVLFYGSECLFFCQYYVFWLSFLCSIIWSQVVWDLQLYSFLWGLFWLFGVFCDSIQIWCFCSISLKIVIGILMGITLNLYIALGNMAILTMLILSIHEHKISFHFIVSFSISFNNVLQFSVYRSFTS